MEIVIGFLSAYFQQRRNLCFFAIFHLEETPQAFFSQGGEDWNAFLFRDGMKTGIEEGTVVPTPAKQMGNQFGKFGL